jgi:hypothetical protein
MTGLLWESAFSNDLILVKEVWLIYRADQA